MKIPDDNLREGNSTKEKNKLGNWTEYGNPKINLEPTLHDLKYVEESHQIEMYISKPLCSSNSILMAKPWNRCIEGKLWTEFINLNWVFILKH